MRWAALALALATAPVRAQTADEGFVINFREADIEAFAEQVSEITGRTLVLDPALDGEITVLSSEPLDREAVWALFQSSLRVRGFVAVQSGPIWQVIPEAQSRTRGEIVTDPVQGDLDVVTRLIPLDRLSSEEAVRVLRPLVADTGYMEALSEPNAVVVTDVRENAERLIAIARSLDGGDRTRTEVIRFRFADATAAARAIADVLGENAANIRLSVDAASNLILVRGLPETVAEIREVAASLDVAPRANPTVATNLQVFRLSFGDAETIAEIIRATLAGGDVAAITNPVAAAVGEAEAPEPAAETVEVGAAVVQASTELNAIVARGTAQQLEQVGNLVSSLDQRRAQVLIEAAIVEVSGEAADRLGLQLGFGDAAPPGGIAATSFGNAGISLQSILLALGQTSAVALTGGLSVGLATDDEFGILLQALSTSTSANLLSTPSITTMDNQPATIVVGQNVPFRTGQFATDGNTVEPFTTIERRDVGITMSVLPRVTAGGVRLEIGQEVSSLVTANVEGAADLITNRRVIDTTVMAQNGDTIVLGGLITDDQSSNESKVPLLGDVPIVGNLFRSRQDSQTRRTLFVFMRPTILVSQADVRAAAQDRLGRLRGTEGAVQDLGLGVDLLRERQVRKLPLEINGLY